MKKSGDLSSILALQKKCSAFFDKVQETHPSSMNCARGCDACCHDQISIFSSEAMIICAWYENLDSDRRDQIDKLWQEKQKKGLNVGGQDAMPCSFLYQGACSIYDVRPIICRTQGLPLLFRSGEETQVAVCPLNFSGERSCPPREVCLDLDRLNTMQSFAYRQVRPSLMSELRDREDEWGRVFLWELKSYFQH